MMRLAPLSLACLLLVLLGVPLSAQPTAGQPTSESPQARLVRHAPSLVSVRYVAEVNAPRVDEEVASTVHCLVIDADGLLLCSNSELGDYFATFSRLMGRSSAPITTRLKDLRVLVDGRELDARLIARDSDRDLAWLQVHEVPEEIELSPLEFTAQPLPEVGERIYLLRRLDEYFGEIPAIVESVVAALPERPRPLIVASPSFGHLGMPVFAADGRLLGLTVAQVPGDEDSNAVMNDRHRALPGQSDVSEDMVGVVLPAADVARATALARETWAADREDRIE